MRGIGELLSLGLAAIRRRPHNQKMRFMSDVSDYPCEFDAGVGMTGDTYVIIPRASKDAPALREANYMPPIDEVFDPTTNKDI